MTSTLTLLEIYKKALHITSDNAAATALGVQRSAVSKWRVGEGHAGPAAVMQMCDKTGEPLNKWLPRIEAERAKGDDKKAWLKLLHAAAALATVYLLFRLDVQTIGEIMAFAPFASIHYAHSRRPQRGPLVGVFGVGTSPLRTSGNCATTGSQHGRRYR